MNNTDRIFLYFVAVVILATSIINFFEVKCMRMELTAYRETQIIVDQHAIASIDYYSSLTSSVENILQNNYKKSFTKNRK